MDAMTEDSPSLPALLTDYILKGKVTKKSILKQFYLAMLFPLIS